MTFSLRGSMGLDFQSWAEHKWLVLKLTLLEEWFICYSSQWKAIFFLLTHFFLFLLLGGAAEQAGNIESGDEILAVSGKSLLGLMHYDAWNIIKSVPEGPVQLLIRKPRTSVWWERYISSHFLRQNIQNWLEAVLVSNATQKCLNALQRGAKSLGEPLRKWVWWMS